MAEILSIHLPVSIYPPKWEAVSDIPYYLTCSRCLKPGS